MLDSQTRRKNSVRRERILEILRSSEDHPTADWIYEQIKKEFPGLSLGTVYRNLKILEEEEKVQSICGGSTFDRYDADMSPHHHVTCLNCGCVMDVAIKVDESIFNTIEKKTGFKISSRQISMTGLCAKCRSK